MCAWIWLLITLINTCWSVCHSLSSTSYGSNTVDYYHWKLKKWYSWQPYKYCMFCLRSQILSEIFKHQVLTTVPLTWKKRIKLDVFFILLYQFHCDSSWLTFNLKKLWDHHKNFKQTSESLKETWLQKHAFDTNDSHLSCWSTGYLLYFVLLSPVCHFKDISNHF